MPTLVETWEEHEVAMTLQLAFARIVAVPLEMKKPP
jgi:hypothetical protein